MNAIGMVCTFSGQFFSNDKELLERLENETLSTIHTKLKKRPISERYSDKRSKYTFEPPQKLRKRYVYK